MAGVACRGLWCVCMVAEMSKDTGMAIHKSIVLLFLSCLVAILGFRNLSYVFCGVGEKVWCMVVVAGVVMKTLDNSRYDCISFVYVVNVSLWICTTSILLTRVVCLIN